MCADEVPASPSNFIRHIIDDDIAVKYYARQDQ